MKKVVKRAVIGFMAVLLVASLAMGCGKKDQKKSNSDNAPAKQEQTTGKGANESTNQGSSKTVNEKAKTQDTTKETDKKPATSTGTEKKNNNK
ncbi:MAG: hypothetical protein LBQ95_03085 [Lachnospiraceae bacterium]|jgi:hypothetical protein|nr:hypothetical protein [Lachnospiraceae bacterium]